MAKKMTVVLSDEKYEELQRIASGSTKVSDFDMFSMFDLLMDWAHFEECEPSRVESWWIEKQNGVWGQSNGKVFKPAKFTAFQQAVIEEMIKEAVEYHD